MQTYLCIASVAALLAVIWGRQVKVAASKGPRRSAARVMAAFGRTFGYLSLATIVLFFIASYYIPRFVASSRRDANQASAVGSLRQINTAAAAYASTYGHGFPSTLESLGPPRTENSNTHVEPSEAAADLIDGYLASGMKSNYGFTYIAGKADGTGKITTYTVHADPIPDYTDARNHYFTDQAGVIRLAEGRAADEHSKPID